MSAVGKELYQLIIEEFERLVDSDEELAALMATLSDYRAVDEYAKRIGEHLAAAFKKYVRGDLLPDGKMLQDIADAAIRPLIENNRRLVNATAEQVQALINKSVGIGLKPVTPKPNTDRVDGIIKRLVEEDNFDNVAWVLDAPVRNITQSFADDYVKANADFQARAGLDPKISRIVTTPCCKWCSDLAGTYTYGEHPEDIFRRHENCDCLVIYEPGDGRMQNSHTKKWLDNENARKIEERKQIGRNSR